MTSQTVESTGTHRSVLSLPIGTWMAHWPGASVRRQSKARLTHSPMRMPVWRRRSSALLARSLRRCSSCWTSWSCSAVNGRGRWCSLREHRRDQADGQGPGVAQSRRVLPACAGGRSRRWLVFGWPVADDATVRVSANRGYEDRGAVDPETAPQDVGWRDNSENGGLFCDRIWRSHSHRSRHRFGRGPKEPRQGWMGKGVGRLMAVVAEWAGDAEQPRERIVARLLAA